MLKVGDRAPDFELADDQGRSVRLSEVLKGGPLLLYFYPADYTPTCTRQACMLRDAYRELSTRGIRVLGVNSLRSRTHAGFRSRLGLPFPLLSDPERTTVRAYGAGGPLGFVRRITYVIGGDGIILEAVRADLRLSQHESLLSRLLNPEAGHQSSDGDLPAASNPE